jgi:hypothetical protein
MIILAGWPNGKAFLSYELLTRSLLCEGKIAGSSPALVVFFFPRHNFFSPHSKCVEIMTIPIIVPKKLDERSANKKDHCCLHR